MDAIPYVDELVNEYLLFRGFIKSFSTFNAEKTVGTAGGSSSTSGSVNIPADVDGLTELILGHVRALELVELMDVWATLRSKFFIHLEQSPSGGSSGSSSSSSNAPAGSSFEPLLRSMELSLKKAVLVKAHTKRRMDKLRECYERLQTEMLASCATASSISPAPVTTDGSSSVAPPPSAPSPSWSGWFDLPYVTDPSTHPLFAPYFHRKWFATLSASLRNFLQTLFRVLPLPRILAFNIEREKRRKQTQELRTLRSDLEKTKAELAQAQAQLGQLRSQGYRVFQQRSVTQPTPAQAQAHAALHTVANGTAITDLSSPSTIAAWPENSPSASAATAAQNSNNAVAPAVDPETDAQDFSISSSSILSLSTPPRDAFSLEQTHILLGHNGPVLKARFSTDGALLATNATSAMEGLPPPSTSASSVDERSSSKIWSISHLLEQQREATRRRVDEAEDAGGTGGEGQRTDPESLETTPKLLASSTLTFTDPLRSNTSGAGAGASAKKQLTTKKSSIRSGGVPSSNHEDLASSSSYLTPSSSPSLHPSLTLSHPVPLSSLAFSTSDRYLLTGSAADGRIGVWSIAGGGGGGQQHSKLLSSFFSGDSALGSPCPVILDLVCSPGDHFLVAAAATKMHCECGPPAMVGGGGGSAAAAAAAGQVASVSELHGVLEKFDLVTGKREFTFASSGAANKGGGGVLSGGAECSQVNSIVLTHNGNMLISGGADGILRVWDTRTSQAMVGWSAHALSAVSCLRLCAGETTVLSAGLDGSMCEWSLHRMGKVVRELRMPTLPSQSPSIAGSAYASSAGFLARPEFALDPSTKYAVLSEGFGWRTGEDVLSSRAFLYDLSHPDPVQAIAGHAGPVLSVDWNSSANLIATASVDHTARILSVKGKPNFE
jgi:WD40 repeat protein